MCVCVLNKFFVELLFDSDYYEKEKPNQKSQFIYFSEELYDLDRVRTEEENLSDLDAEHSIDDYLENTDDFRDWARRKVKGTRFDPENRRPLQVRRCDQ